MSFECLVKRTGIQKLEKILGKLDPLDCLGVKNASEVAVSWAKEQAPMTGQQNAGWNDPQDALRHARWNAEMTVRMDAERAKDWADAHEWVDEDNNDPHENDIIARSMDLHNNGIGRQIGIDHPNSIGEALLEAFENDLLWLWRCSTIQKRFGCGNTPLD